MTKNIELTYDVGALAAAGLSANKIRLQVLLSLQKLHAFIEGNGPNSGKFSLPG